MALTLKAFIKFLSGINTKTNIHPGEGFPLPPCVRLARPYRNKTSLKADMRATPAHPGNNVCDGPIFLARYL